MPLFNFKKGIFKIVIFITTAAEASQNAVARVCSSLTGKLGPLGQLYGSVNH